MPTSLPCPALCGNNAQFAGVCLNFVPDTHVCARGVTPSDPDCLRRRVEADQAVERRNHWLDDSTADNGL
jgi:hypothetical protein